MNALRSELSWTHYRLLLRVERPEARAFYEAETVSSRWSTRELERQINSLLFKRLALSRDQEGVLALAKKGNEIQHPSDLVKDPYVLIGGWGAPIKSLTSNVNVGYFLHQLMETCDGMKGERCMLSRLEKARQDPNSMKAKILATARRIFGEYGYNDTTTRMIAKNVGIDISTLYYHWGEKQDLYEAVVMEVGVEIQEKLNEIERTVSGQSLSTRLEIAIDMMCDYLFTHPEVSNLFLFGYFNKTRHGVTLDIKMSEYIANIAVAMDLAQNKKKVSVQAQARILAVWNTVLNFISGERQFRPMLATSHDHYVKVIKDTLKFILVPAFTSEKE